MPKASVKASASVATAIVLSASIGTLIASVPTADKAVDLAIGQRERTLEKLSAELSKTKGELSAIREAVKPLWYRAYGIPMDDKGEPVTELPAVNSKGKAIAQSEATKAAFTAKRKLAGEQLSRVFSHCKTLRGEHSNPEALARLKHAIKEGADWNKQVTIARGNAKLDESGKLVLIASDNRGGGNRKTPMEQFSFAFGNLCTAAETAKLTILPIGNSITDSLEASALISAKEAKALRKFFLSIG